MAKFHISEDGVPRTCSAEEGNCPIGGDGDHFPTQIQARAAYEARQEASTIAPSLQKKLSKEESLAAAAAKRQKLDTVIPEKNYEYIYTSLKAKDLKPGDRYRLPNSDQKGVVLQRKLGTKNANIELLLEGGQKKVVGLPAEETVFADIKAETEESKQTSAKFFKERGLEDSLKNFEPQRSKVLADFNVRGTQGYSLSSFDYANLIEAQETDNVMVKYERTVDVVKKAIAEGREAFAGEQFPYTRAYERLAAEFQEEINSQARRGGSNSTSEISNAVDRERMKAQADFLQKARWF